MVFVLRTHGYDILSQPKLSTDFTGICFLFRWLRRLVPRALAASETPISERPPFANGVPFLALSDFIFRCSKYSRFSKVCGQCPYEHAPFGTRRSAMSRGDSPPGGIVKLCPKSLFSALGGVFLSRFRFLDLFSSGSGRLFKDCDKKVATLVLFFAGRILLPSDFRPLRPAF